MNPLEVGAKPERRLQKVVSYSSKPETVGMDLEKRRKRRCSTVSLSAPLAVGQIVSDK